MLMDVSAQHRAYQPVDVRLFGACNGAMAGTMVCWRGTPEEDG